jgi:hypothetical protein
VGEPHVLEFRPAVDAADGSVLTGRVVDDRVAVAVEADQHPEVPV